MANDKKSVFVKCGDACEYPYWKTKDYDYAVAAAALSQKLKELPGDYEVFARWEGSQYPVSRLRCESDTQDIVFVDVFGECQYPYADERDFGYAMTVSEFVSTLDDILASSPRPDVLEVIVDAESTFPVTGVCEYGEE